MKIAKLALVAFVALFALAAPVTAGISIERAEPLVEYYLDQQTGTQAFRHGDQYVTIDQGSSPCEAVMAVSPSGNDSHIQWRVALTPGKPLKISIPSSIYKPAVRLFERVSVECTAWDKIIIKSRL